MNLKNKKILRKFAIVGLCSFLIGSNINSSYANEFEDEIPAGMINEFDYENGLSIVPSLMGEGKDEYMFYNYSYKGMTQKEFKDRGLHMAVAMSEDGENWYSWSDMEMYAFDFGTLANYGGYIRMAVVDYPMDNFMSYKDDLAKSDRVLALSNVYSYNVGKVYNQAPYLMEMTPSNQRIQNVGTHKVKAKFSEHLTTTGDVKINIHATNSKAKAEISNIKIENTTEMSMFEGEREVSYVTFDLKTDDTYAGHYANYGFELENVIGKSSKLAPKSFGLSTAFTNSYCNKTFNGVMRAEKKFEIENFDIDTYEYTPVNAVDTGVIVVKEKDNKATARPLTLNCEQEMKPFMPVKDLNIGVNFVDGFDKDATYKAYRFVNGKVVELKTEITEKGLKVTGKDTLR